MSDVSDAASSATTVLVGSADDGTRAQVALTLGTERFRFVEAEDTQTAIRAIASDLPPLVILDEQLPGAGALAIARSVRSQPETEGTRVLVLVGRGDEDLADAPGVDATLAAPFTAFALLRKVEALLSE